MARDQDLNIIREMMSIAAGEGWMSGTLRVD